MFIYLIANSSTGKYYVGQHKGNNLKKYLQDKRSQAKRIKVGGSRLFRSMRKHPDSSVWSIHALRSDIQTQEELNELEKDFIKFLRSQDPEYGYNVCRGGEGFTGPHTEETRKRLSISQLKRFKDNPLSPEAIERLRGLAANKRGIKRLPCVVKAISQKLTGRVYSLETLERMRQGQQRRFNQHPVSEETKRKHSVSMSLRIKTVGFTDEHRKHISEGQSRRWARARTTMSVSN